MSTTTLIPATRIRAMAELEVDDETRLVQSFI
jgi:hypothetical protein